MAPKHKKAPGGHGKLEKMPKVVPQRSGVISGTETVATFPQLLTFLLSGKSPKDQKDSPPTASVTTGLDGSTVKLDEKSMRKAFEQKEERLESGFESISLSAPTSPRASVPSPLLTLSLLNSSQRESLGTLISSVNLGRSDELWRLHSVPTEVLVFLRGSGLFKADRAYRCHLAFGQTVTTSAAGVLNYQVNTASVTSVKEWSNFTGLFDECFVHSFTIKYMPNNLGGDIPAASTSWTGAGFGLPTISGAGELSYFYNLAAIWVSIFGSGNVYAATQAGADQMDNNPTKKWTRTNKPHEYTWKNNVRFDPHGPAFNPAGTGDGWAGWIPVGSATDLVGTAQMQPAGAQQMGDLSHSLQLGYALIRYNVSFRQRV